MKSLMIPLLFGLAVLSGCASSPEEGAAAGTTIQVRVHNDLVPSTSVTVYAVQEGGQRTMLGTVMTGTTDTFRFRPMIASGTHYLVADPPGPGDELRSRPVVFPIDGGARVEWNLMNNCLNVEVVD